MMKLEDLKVYQNALLLGEKVWSFVYGWDYFQKDTIGKQLVRSADSIAANISEGYGRYHFKDSKQFLYYARGSLYETKTWLYKANQRGFVGDREYQGLEADMDVLAKLLNAFIKSIGKYS